jgi:cytochrome c biogenesis protein
VRLSERPLSASAKNIQLPLPAADEAPPGALPPTEQAPERVSDIADLPSTQRVDFIERLWRFFCSLKLMVVLMALFAIGMAAGTFLNPKDDALVEIERAFAGRPTVVWLYRAFELYAPFKSWWFTSIILLLGLNNLASSIERLPRIFQTVRNPERRLTDSVLRGLRNKRTLPCTGQTEGPSLEHAFSSAGYRVSRTQDGGTTYLFGERGAWTRFGVWVVHLALLIICFGGIVGRLFAFEGTMDIPEEGRRNVFHERLPDGTVLDRPLPGFAIQCDKFYLDKFKDGSPRRYASDLEVLDASLKPIFQKKIIVNDPLEWGGMTFYQATYQEHPERSYALVGITDKTTGETKQVKATSQTTFSMGDGSVRFSVVGYDKSFGELGPAVQVVREEGPSDAKEGDPRIKSSSFWVFENYPNFDGGFRDDRFALKFEKLMPSFVTGIQVARDPGVKIIYVGCVLLWIGLFVAFWTVHRRVWARIEGDQVVLAGAAHRNKDRFKEEFDKLVTGLARPKEA